MITATGDVIDVAAFDVLPYLPNLFHPEQGCDVPPDLIGATILQVGTVGTPSAVEGGGLVIDYQCRNGERRRLVLGFTELGMWVEARTSLPAVATQVSFQESP